MRSVRVAIIGGGPGGLSAAYLLQQRSRCPYELTLYEASARLGGKLRSQPFNAAPVLYEAGAAELYDYSAVGPDPLKSLVHELGLTTRPMSGSAVVIADRIIHNSDELRTHFGARTADAYLDFRRKAKKLISPQDYYQSDWWADNRDPLLSRTFHSLLNEIPDPIARNYVRILTHSDLATEPCRTHASYGLQNFLMDEPEYMRLYCIEGGNDRLIQELIKRINASVRLSHRVMAVEKTSAGTYRVTTRHRGEVSSEEFDHVITALPNDWLTAIDWRGERLAQAMHEHHLHYDYPAHYLRASLLFQKPFWRDQITGSYFMLDAFDGCCVYDETSRSDGNLFGVLGWLLAGESAMALSNLEDRVLIDRVLDSLPASLAIGRELFLEGRVHRWIGAVNGKPGGFPLKDPLLCHVPEPIDHPGLYVVGDYLFDSTINGVLDSAGTVVDAIIKSDDRVWGHG